MARLTVAEFAKVVQGQVWGTQNHLQITNIVTDSRHVRTGSLFIAIRGENFDGHDFMKQALEAGAVAAAPAAAANTAATPAAAPAASVRTSSRTRTWSACCPLPWPSPWKTPSPTSAWTRWNV